MSPSCALCGKENASMYSLLPEWSSESQKSPFCYLCDKCRKKLILLTKYIQNKTLYLHKKNYDTINNNFLKESNENLVFKRYFFINLNPLKVINAPNCKRGNGFYKDNTCTFCGNTKNLTIHHPHKRSVFGENDDSIVTLCEECHRELEKEIRKMEIQTLDKIKGIYLFIYKLLFLKKINFEDDKYYTLLIYAEGDNNYFILKNN